MIRQSGATLVEVLVAIFVSALGLLGLLALFPLGAVSMAQAIKDSRCAQAAANAAALAEAMNIRNDGRINDPSSELFFIDQQILDRRNAPILASENRDGPSYPVLVDPQSLALGAPSHLPTAPLPQVRPGSGGIFRKSASFVNSAATATQWFSLLDDINFVKDGPATALPYPLGSVQREGRYSWAYLLRRPRWRDPSITELTVIVFNQRPVALGRGETAYGPVTFDTNSNVVRVYYSGQDKPVIRVGGWILDATMVGPPVLGSDHPPPDPHGYFYRVVNLAEGVIANRPYLDLELQINPKVGTQLGVLVVLEGVAEVFEKGAGWRP